MVDKQNYNKLLMQEWQDNLHLHRVLWHKRSRSLRQWRLVNQNLLAQKLKHNPHWLLVRLTV